MLKHFIGYSICALIVILALNSWHEKDKQVDALTIELTGAYKTIERKKEEADREAQATADRDREYAALDKKMDAVHRSLRSLASSNQELRDMLNMRIPPALLRELRTYSNQYETESSTAPFAAPGNRK